VCLALCILGTVGSILSYITFNLHYDIKFQTAFNDVKPRTDS